jgi:hypothetical protein
VRRLIGDGLIALLALLLWPAALLLGVSVLIRRAVSREPVLSRHDIACLGRRGVGALAALLTVWIFGTIVVALASIFVSVPDI